MTAARTGASGQPLSALDHFEELEGDPCAALIIEGNAIQHGPSKTKNQFRGHWSTAVHRRFPDEPASLATIVGTLRQGHPKMSTVSIRIDETLVDAARSAAKAEFRTLQGQIEFWAKVGRAALDNPDLPASFIAESLMSLNEPAEDATPFVPRSITRTRPDRP